MREGYSVTVSKHGEPILTIERSMLSGQSEFSAADAAAVRDAAEQMLSFIGPETTRCFACGAEAECRSDCPLTADTQVQIG